MGGERRTPDRRVEPRTIHRSDSPEPDRTAVNLHQISVQFDAAQDRLLLRVRSHGGEQFSAWLTRRVMRDLRPALHQASGHLALGSLPTQSTATTAARQMLAESARTQAVGQSDFSRPFEAEAGTHPIGEAPLLPARIDLKVQTDQRVRLGLVETPARTLQMELVQKDWEALLHMIEQALARADWDLPQPAPATPPVPGSTLLN